MDHHNQFGDDHDSFSLDASAPHAPQQHHSDDTHADDAYDGHITGYGSDHDIEHPGVDYEPPSPSYPYYDDQQQQHPDPEVPADDLDPHELGRGHRPVSEVYRTDAVSDTLLEQDNSIITDYLRSRDPDWDNLSQRTDPLNLLELPVDILRLVVKEITHTNDLTSLALTNSTFHALAIPHIYSRFDIVWPDAHATQTEAKSVDALTYGLSTLCMGSSFARTTRRFRNRGDQTPGPLAKFAGNDYAKYTRKFSLGNGPNDWVSEYMITKESGKMLGTLVALALSKMTHLETFVWDMPTGVVSDVFMALGCLPDNFDNGQCMLERVWIRWHDNNEMGMSPSSSSPGPAAAPTAVVPAGSTLTPIGISLPPNATHPAPKSAIAYSESRVEYPTFSVLPPLKSLTVLDVDELAYLDEMSMLIERSADSLQELRVGISNKAIHQDFVQTWDGPELQQVDHNAQWPGESSIGDRRLGGILGVIVGRIYDVRRRPSKTKPAFPLSPPTDFSASPLPPGEDGAPPFQAALSPSMSATTGAVPALETSFVSRPTSLTSTRRGSGPPSPERQRLDGKLKLSTLELERVPLSMQVCSKAFDWSMLTNLTILECAQHENLWKLLKKQFEPKPQESGYGISPTSSKPVPNAPLQYHLNLKRIHTDLTSPALIAFIKETLAPNSLETLFLQDRRRAGSSGGSSVSPPVSIEAIFKGAIKRHRTSLRKLLLNSAAKNSPNGSPEGLRWHAWCLPAEILQYITSGRMTNLKELSACIDYKDWHTFLQRLPNIPQLRSLHIPGMKDHVIANLEAKELVLQIADIITLRPEIQLCYVGIANKCFEILETRPSDAPSNGLFNGGNSGPANLANGGDMNMSHAPVVVEDATDEDDTEDDEHDDDDDDDDDDVSDNDNTPISPSDAGDIHSERSDDDSSADDDDDDDSFVEPVAKTRLRLREILFYDDKIAIFKARHGRL